MKGKIRVAWLLLTALSLLAVTVLGRPGMATRRAQTGSTATAAIGESLRVTLQMTPAVGSPRETRTLAVTLVNERAAVAAPALSLYLPGGMAHHGARLPASTTFNFRENVLNWMPVVPAGESRTLTLPFNTVADVGHPEQTVRALLEDGAEAAEAALTFWTGLPPSASVNARPGVVTVGAPVQLVAQVTGPGPITQSWALGDGRHVAARDPVVVYAEPGRYEVRLQVANPLGIGTATGTVVVVARPDAAFAVDDERPVVGQPVQFSNGSAGEPPLSHWWEFGDGQTSTEREPSHAFTAPGTYEVRLLVQSEHGQSETSQVVTVGSSPTADAIVADTGATGRPIQGQAYTDGSVTAVRWEMGDGARYEGETVSHVYRVPGEYAVTMTAANDFGETVVTRRVQVALGDTFLFLPQLTHGGGAQAAAAPEGGVPITVAPEPAPDTAAPGQTAPAPAAPATAANSAAPVPQVAAPTPASVGPIAANSGGAGVEVEGETSPAEAPPQTGDPAPPAPAPQPAPPQAQPEAFSPVALPPQAALSPQASPAEQLLWYINEARRLHGLPPLAYNYELSIAAQLHTVDMAGHPEIMHGGSDGSRPAQRQRRYGYGGAYGGEAVAWGWESAVPVVEFWVNSPPHRTLILNPDATEVGVGHTADGRAPNLWYWAAEFGIR